MGQNVNKKGGKLFRSEWWKNGSSRELFRALLALCFCRNYNAVSLSYFFQLDPKSRMEIENVISSR